MLHPKSWLKENKAQDLAEYGISLGVIGSMAIFVAFFIRFEVFILWLRAALRIFRAAR